MAKNSCPDGYIPDPNKTHGCIVDKKASMKRGLSEYKKHKSETSKKSKKPATKSEIAKMKSDYQKRVSKLPKPKKKKWWNPFD